MWIFSLGSVFDQRHPLSSPVLEQRCPLRVASPALPRLFPEAEHRRSALRPVAGASKPSAARRNPMTKLEVYPSYRDCFEYHGGTTIQLTRKKGRETVWQDWLMFDTVEAAFEYFNDCCGI
jgi:hypothetical protein